MITGKDFLSILDIEDINSMILKALSLKNAPLPQTLKSKTIALLFEKPSLRTRVSFEVGIKKMGGSCIFLSNTEIGLGKREPESDIAKVLDRLVDGIVARVFSHKSLELLSDNTSLPVINALSDRAHPCQALGDCLTIYENKGNLSGLKLAFIGDGNNIAGSLALACASSNMDFYISSPKEYKLPESIWNQAQKISSLNKSQIVWTENPIEAVQKADIIYTDVWVSMGDEDEKEKRLKTFASYQVNEDLVQHANPDFIFMHDMPAHRGEEISEDMLDHPQSVVYEQSENRLHAQNAIISELFQ
ncbi:MAG: ornithine carbamoyltransferase [Dehalococcoidia bacterium]|nr:ornithine carbamoyltransferase [Dehalococcoidia bacterium]MBS19982.1 ornithine carbamoyltransferase [Chloroflexota bacterium]